MTPSSEETRNARRTDPEPVPVGVAALEARVEDGVDAAGDEGEIVTACSRSSLSR